MPSPAAKQHAHLRRDDTQGKSARAADLALESPVEEKVPQPSLPELGSSGPGLLGGVGERLARLKPEALAVTVPEGPGLTGGAEQASASAAPVAVPQPAATIDSSGDSVSTAPGGAADYARAQTPVAAATPDAAALTATQVASTPPPAPPAPAVAPVPTAPTAAVAAPAAPQAETKAVPAAPAADVAAKPQVDVPTPTGAPPTPAPAAMIAPPVANDATAAAQSAAALPAVPPATVAAPAAAPTPNTGQVDTAVAPGSEREPSAPGASPSVGEPEAPLAAEAVREVATADSAAAPTLDVSVPQAGVAVEVAASGLALAPVATDATTPAEGPGVAPQEEGPAGLGATATVTAGPVEQAASAPEVKASAVEPAVPSTTLAETPAPTAVIARDAAAGPETGESGPGAQTAPVVEVPTTRTETAAPATAAVSEELAVAETVPSEEAAPPAPALDVHAARAAAGLPALAMGAVTLAEGAPLLDDATTPIRAALGSGAPLADHVRGRAEQALDTPLSAVRVHTGEAAASMAADVGARAFASGTDVVLGDAQSLTDGEQAEVMAEELVHVVQMDGKQAGQRGGTGVSTSADPEEKQARSLAQQVLQGARIQAELHANARRALYRNDGPAATPAPAPPAQVTLNLAGLPIVVRVGQLTPGTTETFANITDPGLPGLKLERRVKLRFSPETGRFVGGDAWADVTLGTAVRGHAIRLNIDAAGTIRAELPSLSLTVEGLLDIAAVGRIGPSGVVAVGTADAADLRHDKLRQWLKTGRLDVRSDATGQVTGSGSLGLRVDPLGEGRLAARLEGATLSGQARVVNTAEIPLGTPASAQGGTLTGPLGADGSLQLSGQLGLAVPGLGTGTGALKAQWSSASPTLAGTVHFSGQSPTQLGKTQLASAQVTGSLEEGQLRTVEGQGHGTHDSLIDGDWSGSLDLLGNTGTYSLRGGLAQPIVQGEVTVQGGDLTAQVTADTLGAVDGRAGFLLGAELAGHAVLETGTSAKAIHATATAALTAPRSFGDVTVQDGAMTIRVNGPQVEIAGGKVDFVFRQVAKGELGLTASPDVRRLSGVGTGKIDQPQTWGDIAVQSATVELALQDNSVQSAAGVAQMTWADVAAGQIAFDARKDFDEIGGAATVHLTKAVPLTSPLSLVPDDVAQFQVTFANSRMQDLRGQFGWEYEGWSGQVGVTQPIQDFAQISGSGPADVKAPFVLAQSGGKPLMAMPGGTLTGVVQAGRFVGVRGGLAWQYDGWLAGQAVIPEEKTDIRTIDGMLNAQVVAPKALPGNPKVIAQPGAEGALRVQMVDSTPQRYAGTLAYVYDGFLQGEVHVAGQALDFSQLAGASTPEVIAEKALPNATLIPGGHLAVQFENSGFDKFSGSAAFRYQDWLEGTATVAEKDGAALSTGLAGNYRATLKKALPGDNEFAWQRGGAIAGRLTPGTEINHFAEGSVLGWKAGKWLGGVATLHHDASLRGPTDSSPGGVLRAHVLSGTPPLTLLPSQGLNVELTLGAVTKLQGKTTARLENWAQGQLDITAGNTESLSGSLQGTVVAEKALAGGEATLVPGGDISVPVLQNVATGLSGQIPLRYGSGPGWLRGTLEGRSVGAGLDSLSGQMKATAVTVTQDRPGGLQLRPGGDLTMPMTASHLEKLGGEANFQASDAGVPGAYGGVVALAESSSTQLLDGDWRGNIQKEVAVSPNLKLRPSGDITGKIAQNAVTQVSGTVGWQLDAWLRGTLDLTGVDPHQAAGTGPAQIATRTEIVPGKLWAMPGGDLQATLAGGQLSALQGQVPFLWQDWLAGVMTVQAGTRTSLEGPAEVRVVGPGKVLGPVTLQPGGRLSGVMTGAGVEQLAGSANITYGKPNDGGQWHVDGVAEVEAASASTFKGALSGRLASTRKLPPSLQLRAGGELHAKVDGLALTELGGAVNYAFAPGGTAFLAGKLEVAATSTPQEISGHLDGSVATPIRAGGLTIQPGGNVQGELQRNVNVTVGGDLSVEVAGIAKGAVHVDGQFDPSHADVSGRLEGELLADRPVGPLTLRKGGSLGAQLEHNQVTKIWGQLGVRGLGLTGQVHAGTDAGSTLDSVSGQATLRLDADKAMGDGKLAVKAGSRLEGAVAANQLQGLRGTLDWQYDTWLRGQVVAEVSPDLSAVSGQADATVAEARRLGTHVLLEPGGALRATLSAGKLTAVTGDVRLTWDDWLTGRLALSGAPLTAADGTITGTLLRHVRFGDLGLRRGGDVQAELAGGGIRALRGQVGWQWKDALEGQLTLERSTPDAVTGTGSAALRQPTMLPGGLELQRGGQLQATLTASQLSNIQGDVGWRYQNWLAGRVSVTGSGGLDAPSGEAQATVAQTRVQGNWTLLAGGALRAKLEAGQVEQLGGEAAIRWQDWLDGQLTLRDGPPDAWSGAAELGIRQAHPVGSGLTLERGGHVQLQVDSQKSAAESTASGQVTIGWQDWLRANLTLTPSTLANPSGMATGTLTADKSLGNLVLRRGGTVQAQVQEGAIDSIAGELNWQYGDWLGGTLSVRSPLSLGALAGEGTATLLQEQALDQGLRLLPGGRLRASVADGQPQTLGGSVRYGLEDWLEGTLTLDPTGDWQAAQGTGTGQVIADKALGGELKVRPGSRMDVTVAGGALTHVRGGVKWQYADWLAGTATVDADRLETLDGQADARLLVEKPLPGSAKLLPGGAAQVTLSAGKPKTWAGTLGWQYADWLQGRVTLNAGTTLESLSGKADVRVSADKTLGNGLTLVQGGALQTDLVGGRPGALTGEVHVRYQDWLDGGIHLQSATLDNLRGTLTGAVLADHALGAGVTALRGGHVNVDLAGGRATNAEGDLAIAYQGTGLSVEGTLHLEKSPLDKPTGTAAVRLTAPTAAVAGTVLLPGGAADVKFQAGKATSLAGELEWRHGDWLAGAVTLARATPVAGPFAGEARARLLAEKRVGPRIGLQPGGHLEMALNTAQPMAQSPLHGVVAARLDDWLEGSVTLSPGSTLTDMTGQASLSLVADKGVGQKLSLQKGGTVDARLAHNAVGQVSGTVLATYDNWLRGSVVLEPTADLRTASGDASLQLTAERPVGPLTLQRGGDVRARLEGGQITRFGGMVDWRYDGWLQGNLTVDGTSTPAALGGTGAALVTANKVLGAGLTLQPGGHVRAHFAQNRLEKVAGSLAFDWQNWVAGTLEVEREADPAALAGQARVRTLVDKRLNPQALLLAGSRAEAHLENAALSQWQGQLGLRVGDFVQGKIDVQGGAKLEELRGQATVTVLREKPLGSKLDLLPGGTLSGDFDGQSLGHVEGTAAIRYDKWLRGTVSAQGEGGLEHLGGHASLQVEALRKFGQVALRPGTTLEAEFANSAVTQYRGNVDITLENWLAGNLRFTAADLATLEGEATLNVTQDKPLLGPLVLQTGSRLRGRVAQSALADFGGLAKLQVRGWGTGELGVRDGSTLDQVSGAGKLELGQPKALGPVVTLTSASLGAEVENNQLGAVWGRAQGDIRGLGSGWLSLERSSTLDSFDGQAGFKLTRPRPIGRFAELSGGDIVANFQRNALQSFGGSAEITVHGWGKGSVQVDPGSTLENLSGMARLQLTQPRTLAGGTVRITGGQVSARVEGQSLRQVAGAVDLELPGIARGQVNGEIDLERNTFSGQGRMQQLRAWRAGPATVTDGTLEASVVDGRLASASGSARVDAGKLGQGTFEVSYEDTGAGPLMYGRGQVQFAPHERVQGKLGIQLSRDQKLTGSGELDVKITEKIRGKATAALDEAGHVKLAGAVTVPGPFELFKPEPWKKDLKFLDTSFLVYTPPTVKVKVGAGMGMEVGVRPLTLRNLSIGGAVDLMDPAFASMTVGGELSSSAYADLNLYAEGSVQVSAVVVAVNAGLRGTLNLHLNAGIQARPTLGVNRKGLSFDMPVDAQMSAALNLILTFFAKVRVGVDLGIVSVMETVWNYDKSPDPLRLGDFSLNAKGRVQSDEGGTRASLNPEYNPPDLSIESLKKALKL